MKRWAAFLALSAMMAVAVVPACSDSDSGVSADELQPIVDEWAERHAVSDMAVSVRSPSGAFTSVGYSTGDETPDDSSLWMIGSITKTLTAATVLLLVEDGTLELDVPIERWLPDFRRADEITLRMLLSHTAGIANDIGPVPDEFVPAALDMFREPTTVAENLEVAENSVGDVDLPAQFSYSNPGYVVVGAVIEAATGEALADLQRARIVEPLGLENTYLAWSEPVAEPMVPGELGLPDGMRVPLGSEFVPAQATWTWAAGGVVSSAGDTAAFFGALFDDLLGPESVEAMKTGLGIVATRWPDDKDGWFHRGGAFGYLAAAGVSEDGWSVAVLSNRFDVANMLSYQEEGIDPDPVELIGELMAHVTAEG